MPRSWKPILKLALESNWCKAHWKTSITWSATTSKAFGQSYGISISNLSYLHSAIQVHIGYEFQCRSLLAYIIIFWQSNAHTSFIHRFIHSFTCQWQTMNEKNEIIKWPISILDSHLFVKSTVWIWIKVRTLFGRIFVQRFFLLLPTAVNLIVLHCLHHWNRLATHFTGSTAKNHHFTQNKCIAIGTDILSNIYGIFISYANILPVAIAIDHL